ncbi:small ribosomal subunit protein mS31 [Acanthopagrus schlegelii]
MFRLLFRTVYTARNYPVSVNESLSLLAKCDKANCIAPALRVSNGGGLRALSTSSVRLCEKKNESVTAKQDEGAKTDAEADPKEKKTLVTQEADEDSKVIKMAEQSEEPLVSKADDGSSDTQQQQVDVKTEQDVVTPEKVETAPAMNAKESLLALLGGMKVDVTSKRKPKIVNEKQIESTPVSRPPAMESTISMFQQATEEASSQSVKLDPELVAAASAAASTLPNPSQAESQLLRQLRQHEAVTEAQKKGDTAKDLGLLIAEMKIGKHSNRQNARPANQIRFDEDGQGYTHDRGITSELDSARRKRNLFSGKRLNIFTPGTADGAESAVARLTLWDLDFAHQLSEVTNQMPRNGLEEMIQWTKEGKMWQYPINNEIGLEEEASVSFHEHIFLEKHIEEGFPQKGPVRHFMELVLCGLSKNPFLTVQQKKEHIDWFRDYFHQKEEVLNEAGVYLK